MHSLIPSRKPRRADDRHRQKHVNVINTSKEKKGPKTVSVATPAATFPERTALVTAASQHVSPRSAPGEEVSGAPSGGQPTAFPPVTRSNQKADAVKEPTTADIAKTPTAVDAPVARNVAAASPPARRAKLSRLPEKSSEPIIVPPRAIKTPAPAFPGRCYRSGRGNISVTLQFTVTRLGTVSDPQVIDSTDTCLNRAALRAVGNGGLTRNSAMANPSPRLASAR